MPKHKAPQPGIRLPAGQGHGHWRTYDVTDGLAGLDVRSIYSDWEGNLWFGTWSGVSRYDGNTFTTFTTENGLVDDAIWSICQDRKGNIWFGTEGGVSRFDGEGFTAVTTQDGLASNHVLAIAEDKEGFLWFGTEDGLSRFDGESFTTFTTADGLAHNEVRAIFPDQEGNLWFGTQDGLSRFDGESFTTFTTADGLAHNEVQSILQDQEGNLWFGTQDGASRFDGLFFTKFYHESMTDDPKGSRYDGQTKPSFPSKEAPALLGVLSIFQDEAGNLWFGTLGGVCRYDGVTFITFTTEDGLAHNRVQSICQDREGRLWFGTYGGGVSQYDGETLITFTTVDGLANDSIQPMLRDREGKLWFGTQGGGVCRYDGRTFTTFTTADGLAHNAVHSILQDEAGDLWFGTPDGVCRYDGQTFTTFTTEYGLAHNAVHSILQDESGYLWFGTSDGISRYDGQVFTTFTQKEGLGGNLVRSMCQDRKGHIWFGTKQGLARYDGQKFAPFTMPDKEMTNQVVSIVAEVAKASGSRDGQLWYGTPDGVIRYDGQKVTTFTTQDGLAHNVVQVIFEDEAGHIWFGTEVGGVSVFDGQVFQTLTRDDGLAGNSVWSILQDDDGDIWFATLGGVTRYRPPKPSPPDVVIDAVVAEQRYEGVNEVTVHSNVRLVAFEFHARSFKTRPEAMVYRYRFRGYEENWQNTNALQVEYQDLPEGNYTFELQAVDRDLVYSEPVHVTIEIVPAREKAEDALMKADEELSMLSQKEAEGWGIKGFIGKSQTFKQTLDDIRRLQEADETIVLITGESGTGKGLIARAIHFGGTRAKGPFHVLDCSAIPGELVESYLFGHVKGAFTGASEPKKGYFELADGGTLFLDEIGDMPLELQTKLLRVLEDGRFTPVGGTAEKQVDVRVLAATNADLQEKIIAGTFRSDLYFRLAQFRLPVAPLRERREDIPLLVSHFLKMFATDKEEHELNQEAMSALEAYNFPGNVRELENIIGSALILSGGGVIKPEHLHFEDLPPASAKDVSESRPTVDTPMSITSTQADPGGVQAFLDECCEFHPDAGVRKPELLQRYQEFCQIKGYEPITRNKFYSRILQISPQVRDAQIGTDRLSGFKGLMVKPSSRIL